MGGYPAQDHWARRQALGLDSAPFHVPALEILQRLSGSDQSERESEARSHRRVKELLAPPPQPATYEEARGKILELCSPRPDMSEPDREQAMALNLRALEFFAELDELIDGRERIKAVALEQRHREVYQRCRELSDRVTELRQASGYQNNLRMTLDNTRACRSSECSAIRDRRPSRFPSSEELQEWRAELDVAEEKLAEAARDHREAEEARDQTDYELATAQRELTACEAEEKTLREQLRK